MRHWLKEKRYEFGMSRVELAQRINKSEQFVYYLEVGERDPHPNTAKKIAEVLGFDWTRFFE